MASLITTDTKIIAKCIASVCYGSASAAAESSRWNPEGRTNNCVFVSLAYSLGISTVELARQTRLDQPGNESRGLEWVEIAKLLDRAIEVGLISAFQMSYSPLVIPSVDRSKLFDTHMLLYLHPPGPDGKRKGHCVTSHDRYPYHQSHGRYRDYQHHDQGRSVQNELRPFENGGQTLVKHLIFLHKPI